MLKVLKLTVVLLTVLFTLQGGQRSASSTYQDLPTGTGVEVVREKCLLCHEADLIVQQRLSRTGWVREVEKMIRWGTVVTDSEKEVIIAYLAGKFSPRGIQAAAAVEESGRKIFEEKCLLCHEGDLTEQQRLTRAGWTREVEKMIRWGADVSAAEKEPLIDYLTQRCPAR